MRFKYFGRLFKKDIENEIMRRKYGMRVIDLPSLMADKGDFYITEIYLSNNKKPYAIIQTFCSIGSAILHVEYCKEKGIVIN